MLDTEWLKTSHQHVGDLKNKMIGSPLSACFVSNFTEDDFCLEQSDCVSKKVAALGIDGSDSDLDLRTACCQVVSIGTFQDWNVDETLVNCRYRTRALFECIPFLNALVSTAQC
jgi:hypothetical protein